MSFIIRTPKDKLRAKDAIDAMGFSPVQIVRIGDYKKNRSRAQNDTLHQWIGLIAEHTGYTMDEVKDKLVLSLWEPVKREIKVKTNGKLESYTLIERRSTTTLSVEEMSRLMDATVMVASDLGIVLPFGDEYLESLRAT